MKTTAQKARASALIVTMLVIFLIAVAIAIAMNMTTSTVRQTDASRDFSALRSAAEGALDYGYGVWAKRINSIYGPVSNADLAASLGTAPAFPGFTYNMPLRVVGADQYGRPDSTAGYPQKIRVNLATYPGWIGLNTSYLASVKLSGQFAGGRAVEYGVKRAINYTVVPLFQATAFFEDNLELYKTAPMTIGGLVHTNSTAYVSSSASPTSGKAPTLAFSGNVSHAGGYVDGVWTDGGGQLRDAPPEAWNWSGYTANSSFPPNYTNGGQSTQLAQVNRIEPLGADAAALLHPPVDVNGSPTGDTNPNDDSMRELIEPPVTSGGNTDPPTIAERRLYNKAGIRIHTNVSTNSGGAIVYTTTITAHNGTSLTDPQKTALASALNQQTIYDRREGRNISVTTLDVAAANATLNSASGFNNIIYVDQTDQATGTILPNKPQAIRLKNGATLPTGGLTVGSQNPVYIQGDYNTTSAATRGSAAVFADAVTILSNAWNDANSSADLSARTATNTTVNTAIVAGFLPSGWRNPATGAQYGYSGGLNNFPRFLENWGGQTFTYTGSMIELFTSQVNIGEWDTGAIYRPPIRVWNFDGNFVENPPPGSLDAVSIGRGALARF